MAKARKLIAGLLNTTMPQKIKRLRCEITMYIKQTLYLKGIFDTRAELNNRGIQSIQILEGAQKPKWAKEDRISELLRNKGLILKSSLSDLVKHSPISSEW